MWEHYYFRVTTVSDHEKSGENEIVSGSGNSQWILYLVREIWNSARSQGKVWEIYINLAILKFSLYFFNV